MLLAAGDRPDRAAQGFVVGVGREVRSLWERTFSSRSVLWCLWRAALAVAPALCRGRGPLCRTARSLSPGRIERCRLRGGPAGVDHPGRPGAILDARRGQRGLVSLRRYPVGAPGPCAGGCHPTATSPSPHCSPKEISLAMGHPGPGCALGGGCCRDRMAVSLTFALRPGLVAPGDCSPNDGGTNHAAYSHAHGGSLHSNVYPHPDADRRPDGRSDLHAYILAHPHAHTHADAPAHLSLLFPLVWTLGLVNLVVHGEVSFL